MARTHPTGKPHWVLQETGAEGIRRRPIIRTPVIRTLIHAPFTRAVIGRHIHQPMDALDQKRAFDAVAPHDEESGLRADHARPIEEVSSQIHHRQQRVPRSTDTDYPRSCARDLRELGYHRNLEQGLDRCYQGPGIDVEADVASIRPRVGVAPSGRFISPRRGDGRLLGHLEILVYETVFFMNSSDNTYSCTNSIV